MDPYNFGKNFNYPTPEDLKDEKTNILEIYERDNKLLKARNQPDEKYLEDRPYESLNKKFTDYNPFSKIAGACPGKNNYETESSHLNRHMKEINRDKQSQSDFYNKNGNEIKNEIHFLTKVNKADHVKKIFSTLNFRNKPTSYNESYLYTAEKKQDTIDHQFNNHIMKNPMKTYEENKIMHQIIIRK